MGSIVEHKIKRIDCKRLKDEITKYGLTYNFDIPKKEVIDKILKLDYIFNIYYKEGIGEVTVEGSLGYKDTLKVLKDAEQNFEKNAELQQRIYNVIFKNAITLVLDLTRHLGLPSPVFLPEIKPEQLAEEKR
jgi:hypothetical protein